MKKILSLSLTMLLFCSMLLGTIPASAATVGPYNYTVGCIQGIAEPTTKSLVGGSATYYQTLVTSRMQNEADRVQSYNTHVVVGTSKVKFFAYSAESDDKMGYGLKTTIEIAKDFEKANPDYKVVAAVNGDFFNTATGEPESPMIQNGDMLKSYILKDMIGRGIVGVNDTTGEVVYHTIGDAYKEAGYGVDYTFDGVYQIQVLNADKTEIDASYSAMLASAPNDTTLSFTTSNVGNGSYANKTVYVVELEEFRNDTGSHNKNPHSTSNYYAYGKVTEVITGTNVMRPASGKVYIAVANDTQAPKLAVGAYVKCQKVLTGEWENVSNAIGFKQQLIANGSILFNSMYSRYHHSNKGASTNYGEEAEYYCDCGSSKTETEKWTEDLYDYPMCWKHRTAIGFKANGEYVLMTVQRSEGEGWGATYVELATQLRALGCFNAFLLDGGGSSTMVIRDGDELTTVFKGENGLEGEGRVVANAVILAVPKSEPADTTDISAAIAKAEALKKDDYNVTDEAWNALTLAIANAKAIVANEGATQEDVDLSLAGLVSAISEVEKAKKPTESETEPVATEPAATDAPSTDANNDVTEPAIDNSGCGSSISLAATATVCAIGAIAVKKKRKK